MANNYQPEQKTWKAKIWGNVCEADQKLEPINYSPFSKYYTQFVNEL